MTEVRAFWHYFIVDGLQVCDHRLAKKLWHALMEHEIPGKQSKLFQLSRVVDSVHQHEPQAIRHFYRAFSPQVMVTLVEKAVETKRLKRQEGNFITEQVLSQTLADGSWDVD